MGRKFKKNSEECESEISEKRFLKIGKTENLKEIFVSSCFFSPGLVKKSRA